MAFLSAAVTEELYSGEEIRSPWCDFMSSFRRLAPSGVPLASRSSSNKGRLKSARRMMVTSAPAAFAPLAAFWTIRWL